MEQLDPVEIYMSTILLATAASMIVPMLQHITGRKIPDLEYLKEGEKDIKPKIKSQSLIERYHYILCCAVCGLLIGIVLPAYWFGFDKLPNVHQQIFWPLVIGFLSQQVLMYAQTKNIKEIEKEL
ncbi:hypothetical protein [Microbulbifer sp. TRSA005]|uniref:hypothetical protein n=1 Tax=Microbulbifer sp. TRSA005 TaxID=3243383 RepID=UPI0040396008